MAYFLGTWEGHQGDDIAPGDDRGTENNKFREQLVFEDAGLVENHEQKLQALRYALMAWRIGVDVPFHEERGYYIWEAQTQQLMRSFTIPRGVALIAGGKVDPSAKETVLRAEYGSFTYGICSNPFLDVEFRTQSFEMKIKILGADSFSYDEDTILLMKGRKEPFHHRDQNTLMRVK